MPLVMVSSTIWVCEDCMFLHVTGEVSDDRPADYPSPWAVWEATRTSVSEYVTFGMVLSEHEEGCDHAMPNGCECEHISFSSASCDGCGQHLAGDRYAFTTWTLEEK